MKGILFFGGTVKKTIFNVKFVLTDGNLLVKNDI